MLRNLVFAILLGFCVGLVPAEEKTPPGGPQLADLRADVAADPENEELRRKLAIALFGSNLREEAVEQFEWLAEKSPDVRSLLDLALGYSAVSRLDEAEAAYARLLKLSPNHAIALHNLGNVAYKRGETDKSIELYKKAIAADPGYLLAYAHLGDAYRQAERYQEAYRAYEKVLDLEPKNATELSTYDDALYRLASLDLQMGAYERAGMLLSELLRANPEHPSGYYAYGQVLMHLGKVEDAQKAFAAHLQIQAKQKHTSPMAHGD
jgi:tetratricopeptide (TPR) repeat protein